MKAVENQTLLGQLQWRYATKKFDPSKKVSAEDWNTLEQAMILAPSSYGLEPWHFVVITSQPVKDSLVSAAYGQHQVSQASHLVVFALRKGIDQAYINQFIQRISDVRGVPLEKLAGYKQVMVGSIEKKGPKETEVWSARQVYIAMGFLLSAAALLGIDVCPMEGIDAGQVDQILGLEQKGLTALAIAAVGYRAADDHAAQYAKVRFKTHDVVTHID